MSIARNEALRRVLDNSRSDKQYVVVPAADFKALADTCAAESGRPATANGNWAPAPRDPAYEREMRMLFDNAELDP
jgi:hypothetical protein